MDNDDLKAEWADTLGGFHAEDIAAALKACRAQPKAPNLPEFASLCRQNMNTRTTKVEPPLSPEDRAAAAKVADAIAKAMRDKHKAKGYVVNGVTITPYKQWAVNLVRREASGEQIEQASMEAWREVLGYPADVDAGKVLETINQGQRQ